MEDKSAAVDLDRIEELVVRLERAARDLAASEQRLAESIRAIRDRDRAAAFDAWRRGQ